MWSKCLVVGGGGEGVRERQLHFGVDVAYGAWFFKPSLLSRQKYSISYTHIGPGPSL